MAVSRRCVLTVFAWAVLCSSIAAGQQPTKAPAPSSATTQPAELTVQDILERVKKTYGECKSYRDTGNLEITAPSPKEPGSTFTVTYPFTTAFVRGDRIRIEASHPFFKRDAHIVLIGPKTVSVCAQGTAVTIERSQMPKPVSSALAGLASEVSRPFALNVPRLLLGEDGASMIEGLEELTKKPNEKVGNVECLVITGHTSAGEALNCWIDANSYTIQRLRFEEKKRNETVIAQITYKPMINPEIDPKELEFNPPAGCDVVPAP